MLRFGSRIENLKSDPGLALRIGPTEISFFIVICRSVSSAHTLAKCKNDVSENTSLHSRLISSLPSLIHILVVVTPSMNIIKEAYILQLTILYTLQQDQTLINSERHIKAFEFFQPILVSHPIGEAL
ncbi:hypothetical protein H5410_026402 [Solanum commersonii]|uniref:Uncharacterized protein n=1 Tax=Solanum commersonii TaxID=4109 RepID=A0A9J5Z1E8_SOLCO|nr:hypothetical protein H5410_026402 [Solanum commersonii]